MTLPLYLQFMLAGVASAGFAVLFNCPRHEIFACGICGGFAWLFYVAVYHAVINETLGVFCGAIAASVLSRIYSYRHRAPSTVYLITGIMPLVPGSQMYSTMRAMLASNIYESYMEITKAFQFAGVIAIAIVIVFSLPYSCFELGNQKDKPKK